MTNKESALHTIDPENLSAAAALILFKRGVLVVAPAYQHLLGNASLFGDENSEGGTSVEVHQCK